MSAQWRIEIRLGDGHAPLRSVLVEADTEVDALRQVLAEAERDHVAAEELLLDGQEEVFSRTEVQDGHVEHQAQP
ncbi:hypothetical protein V7S57_05935 [Caulobacter sp. CCNWLY153]|jgi:hypothetical protein|uniref:Uncharacterized protein n=1 Tax=Caulobacter radicis TaxID=2172650 RepID=A0A2T9JZ94_9CAUL|nr:hypothetical protein [Caulobacter radicis]PVM86068.1 hypothetical protein DDF62_17985 [Caulobacter radicis]PVM89052.1 hypothetical protein DDF65_00765 [Caulobacter radicis]